LTSDKPKPGEEDPQERIQELEGQIAAFAQGALLQKKDFEDKIVEATKAAQLDVVKARVLEQKVADVRRILPLSPPHVICHRAHPLVQLEEQLKVANERAYDAESRLGRLQKSHQQLVVEKNKANFAAAAPKAHSVDISADVAEMDAIGDELANVCDFILHLARARLALTFIFYFDSLTSMILILTWTLISTPNLKQYVDLSLWRCSFQTKRPFPSRLPVPLQPRPRSKRTQTSPR
jgi:hypothetical protein